MQDSFVLPSRASFAEFAATRTGRDTRRLVTELLRPRAPYRGLLLFHEVGTGKTCLAVSALHAWLRSAREVLVLTPASLRENFRREMTGNVCGVFRDRGKWAVAPGIEALLPGVRAVAEDLRVTFPVTLPESVLIREAAQDAAKPPTDADKELAARIVSQSLDTYVRFVSYNGLTAAARRQLADPAQLAGRLVIVDEAHNFAARAKELLRAMMDASRCRVLLMTATPIVNAIQDAVPLLNLCRGWVTRLRVRVPARGAGDARADAALRAVPELFRVIDEISVQRDAIEMTLLPEGFAYADDARREVVPAESSDAARRRDIAQALGVPVSAVTVENATLFPEDPEAFAEAYLDKGWDAVRKDARAPFLRRIAGLVSYRAQNIEGFPRVFDPKVVPVSLGKGISRRYGDERRAELLAEKRGRNVRLYFAYTRAIANFAWPAAYRRRRHAGDVPDEDGGTDEVDADGLLARLAREAADTIAPAHIADHSPKMAAVVARLTAAPAERHLVFSNFRTLEGVRTLALVLRAHGYRQVHPEGKTSPPLAGTKPNGLAFLDLAEFGGDASVANSGAVQVALASRSSSEGLSLRGYTQVHMLDPPFTWNTLEQVRGRAARRTSHVDLPPKMRHVRTFVYVARLDPPGEETSDEKMVALMMRKEARARGLYALLEAGAVNCAWESSDPKRCGVAPEDPTDPDDRLWSVLRSG